MAVKNIVIKRGNNIVASVPPTSMSLVEKVMGGGVITASFSYYQPFAFMIGDFIEISNVVFKLNVLPKITKEGTNKYQYDCVFEDQFFDLGKTEFMVIGDVEFDLVGDLMTFAQLLVQNLNRTGSGWTVGSVQDSIAKNIHFSCENCLSVAQKLCSQDNFDCEMYLVGKQINFQSFGTVTGHVLKYGYNKGLYSITRDTVSSTNIVTRLYAYGSNKNIPSNYRNYSPRLKFSVNGRSYIENNTAQYGVIEHGLLWEDIYPRRTGTISYVSSTDVYKFRDASLDFDIKLYLMPGVTAKIHMQSGLLGGYEFEITEYDHTTREFTVIRFDDGKGGSLPNSDIKFAVGDTYVLVDILMPPTYITAAETLLYNTAMAYLLQNSSPRVNYTVVCDPSYFKRNNIDLGLGNYVTIQDADLSIDKSIRIIQRTKNMLRDGDVALVLADNIEKSQISRMYASILETRRLVERGGLADLPRTKNPWRKMGGDVSKAYVDAVAADLQNQIDGNVTSWYYPYNPTLSNVPASDWTTETDRKAHQGDTFTNTLTGQSWKFLYATNWYWKDISDTMAAQALAAAIGAQETADGKIRCFKTTPTTPYDVGDLWSKTSGIMICNVARASGSYNSADWGNLPAGDNTKDSIDSGVTSVGGLRVGSGGVVSAGMDGAGTAGTDIRLWAGSTYEQRANAPYKVLANGTVLQGGGTFQSGQGSFPKRLRTDSDQIILELNKTGAWRRQIELTLFDPYNDGTTDGTIYLERRNAAATVTQQLVIGPSGIFDNTMLNFISFYNNNMDLGSTNGDVNLTSGSGKSVTADKFTFGKLIGPLVEVSAARTVQDQDFTIVSSYIGTQTVPLAASNPGRILVFKRNNQPGTLTLSRSGSDIIEGASTLALSSGTQGVMLQSDGVNTWYAIARIY